MLAWQRPYLFVEHGIEPPAPAGLIDSEMPVTLRELNRALRLAFTDEHREAEELDEIRAAMLAQADVEPPSPPAVS